MISKEVFKKAENILIVLAIVFIAGCSSNASSLIGTWSHVETYGNYTGEIDYTFFGNNTLYIKGIDLTDNKSSESVYLYEANDTAFRTDIGDFRYRFFDNVIEITDPNGSPTNYTKVQE